MKRATLEALANRIVPPDDWPGAVEANVLDYVQRQLAGDLRAEAGRFAAGVGTLDAEAEARHGRPFDELGVDRMDALLADVERGEVGAGWPVEPAAWFALAVTLVCEGYYADPGNGGNRNRAAWDMVGYSPEPKREHAEPKREHAEPKREHAEPKREHA